ncbi:MAG: cytochrome c maturation protein CcmE, partial [Deltaproteobacteria bacterium]|nr:cytochrome c maturation protein CcmE [Deltaproteobacteria bacterium]
MKIANLKQTKYVFFIGFALLGLIILLTSTLPNSFQYYLTVSEYTQDLERYKDAEVKLAGHVVPGTIE